MRRRPLLRIWPNIPDMQAYTCDKRPSSILYREPPFYPLIMGDREQFYTAPVAARVASEHAIPADNEF